MRRLERGLYERLVDEKLLADLAEIGAGLAPSRKELRRAEAGDRLALHVAKLVERAVDGLPEQDRVDRGVALTRAIIETLARELGQEELREEVPVSENTVLRALLARQPDGSLETLESPLIPLLDTTLLTNAPGEPRVGHQIQSEIGTAQRIDVIMAFIRRSGIQPFIDSLRRHCARGQSLRVLTTTYTGSGEHFTPRDVVHLMVDLLFSGDEERLRKAGIVRSVYDPCCGSGGMLTIAKEHVTKGVQRNGELLREPIAPKAEVHLFGQEVNPETFAICKSDLFMKSEKGEDAERILFGSTLSNDRHEGKGFDYLIANPPYGKDWKRDKDAVEREHERGAAGRFGPGTPRISDGQLLFLLHMLAHMQKLEAGGSRVAIIMNGSPLFTGDAGSGESEIRRTILENDWLEALVALPEQLFYNTGIATYVWVLTNRKSPERKGQVQLIDATTTEESIRFWRPMRKSLGDKRREIPFEKAREILGLLRAVEDGAARHIEKEGEERDVVVSKVFPTTHFGFRKITVERPLRLDFQASPERIARLEDERAFANLATSKKRKGPAKEKEEAEGRAQQAAIRALLGTLPGTLFTDRQAFEKALTKAVREAGVKLAAPVKKAILSALSERNEQAEICRDKEGHPEPDPELRDTESVPLAEPIDAFFEREVLPHVPDAWIDTARRDPKDGEVGLVGYEINFNRYFYEYRPPRPLEAIEADIQAIEKDIVAMLREVAG